MHTFYLMHKTCYGPIETRYGPTDIVRYSRAAIAAKNLELNNSYTRKGIVLRPNIATLKPGINQITEAFVWLGGLDG